ncbi:MAG: hypothetical protein P4L83_11415 [Nevskia sp.]|nr:hypothetical protein [Nevskia sp.]
MSSSFFDELCDSRPPGAPPVERDRVAGYLDAELPAIELRYDVTIAGQLRAFLLSMGRCDGGLIGDDPLVLYRPSWTGQDQLAFQRAFRERLQSAELGVYCEEKPFAVTNESEVHYYFLLTASTEPDLVFHYNQTEESAHSTGLPLLEYLKGVLRRYAGYGQRAPLRGELLSG